MIRQKKIHTTIVYQVYLIAHHHLINIFKKCYSLFYLLYIYQLNKPLSIISYITNACLSNYFYNYDTYVVNYLF